MTTISPKTKIRVDKRGSRVVFGITSVVELVVVMVVGATVTVLLLTVGNSMLNFALQE